jgi:hypothetical protein
MYSGGLGRNQYGSAKQGGEKFRHNKNLKNKL